MVDEAREFLVFVAWILGPILGLIFLAWFWIYVISKGITKGINESMLGRRTERDMYVDEDRLTQRISRTQR